MKNFTWLWRAIIYTVMFDIVPFSSRILNFCLWEILIYFSFLLIPLHDITKLFEKRSPSFDFQKAIIEIGTISLWNVLQNSLMNPSGSDFFCLSRLWIFYFLLSLKHLSYVGLFRCSIQTLNFGSFCFSRNWIILSGWSNLWIKTFHSIQFFSIQCVQNFYVLSFISEVSNLSSDLLSP